MWQVLDYYCRKFRKLSFLPYCVDRKNKIFRHFPYRYRIQRFLLKVVPCVFTFHILACGYHLAKAISQRKTLVLTDTSALVSLILSLYMFFITSGMVSTSYLISFTPLVAVESLNPIPHFQRSIKRKLFCKFSEFM